MRTHYPVLAFLLALSAPLCLAEELPSARPESAGFSSDRLGRLTDALQAYVDDGKLAGGVVIVARRGRVALLHPFGQRDIEAGSPMPRRLAARGQVSSPSCCSMVLLKSKEVGMRLRRQWKMQSPNSRHDFFVRSSTSR